MSLQSSALRLTVWSVKWQVMAVMKWMSKSSWTSSALLQKVLWCWWRGQKESSWQMTKDSSSSSHLTSVVWKLLWLEQQVMKSLSSVRQSSCSSQSLLQDRTHTSHQLWYMLVSSSQKSSSSVLLKESWSDLYKRSTKQSVLLWTTKLMLQS